MHEFSYEQISYEWPPKCPGAVRHQTVHERYVCVLRIVKFFDAANFSKIGVLGQILLCIAAASTGQTPMSRIFAIQYYIASNRNESLLRRPHVAGALCSENASTGQTPMSRIFLIQYYIESNSNKSLLRRPHVAGAL